MRPITPKYILAACAITAALYSSTPVSAQTYQSWENPDAPNPQSNPSESDKKLKDLVDKLNALIDQAETDRAANPVFLRDLRDLANGFGQPRSMPALFDDFSDGDYTRNPVWVVAAGRYWIEKGWGLRNELSKTSGTTSSSGSRDPAADLLGKILNKALGGSGTVTSGGASGSEIKGSSIYSDALIGNAFSIKLDVSSWVKDGTFMFGPYQGAKHDMGYRLIYKVGGEIELVVQSRSGNRSIHRDLGPFKLEDQKAHAFEWTRGRDGMMRISLDGKKLFETLDLSFRDPFDGFGMATSGGDFIVKRVSIDSSL